MGLPKPTKLYISWRPMMALAALLVLGACETPVNQDARSEGEALRSAGVRSYKAGDYRKAEDELSRAIPLLFSVNDQPGRLKQAVALINIGDIYQALGKNGNAETAFRKALGIREAVFGNTDNVLVADVLIQLSEVLPNRRRHVEALSVARRAFDIYSANYGANDVRTSQAMHQLARVLSTNGRLGEAEDLYRRVLDLRSLYYAEDDLRTAATWNNLAAVLQGRGRPLEALQIYLSNLAIREAKLGGDHPGVARTLRNLANAQSLLGRYADAERYYSRARTISEQAGALTDAALALEGLAKISLLKRDYVRAEELSNEAWDLRRKVLGEKFRSISGLENLGKVYLASGRLKEAEAHFQEVHEIRMKGAQQNPRFSLDGLLLLAKVRRLQGAFSTSEANIQTFLKTAEQLLPSDYPTIAEGYKELALVRVASGNQSEAMSAARRATSAYRSILSSRGFGSMSSDEAAGELTEKFYELVGVYSKLAQPALRDEAASESFETMQMARLERTSETVLRSAARTLAGQSSLAALAREREEAVDRLGAVDSAILSAGGADPADRDLDMEKAWRSERIDLQRRLKTLDDTLAEEFPRYKELTAPRAVPAPEIQALLRPGEALVAYLVGEKESYAWVARSNGIFLQQLDIGREDLNAAVKGLRRSLDPAQWPATIEGIPSSFAGNLPAFDFAASHRLYQAMFKPLERYLSGTTSIFVFADGALQSLPFAALVSEAQPAPQASPLPDYRGASWLARKYAFTTIPSVSSLMALRQVAQASKARQPFIGFGDPTVGGGGRRKDIEVVAYYRGRFGNSEPVRRSFVPLPETAAELQHMARTLGASESSVLLGAAATERQVRTMELSNYRVVAFATHGLMAGEFAPGSEPALVLTPPREPGPEDDGLLTASEVAQLKLDADLVVLSACNTAAPDGTPGAGGLSGLARAFFYAGARALLVSHWAVESDAAARLTTTMLDELDRNPGLARGEALRRATLRIIDDPERTHLAHPAFWAPLAIVGD